MTTQLALFDYAALDAETRAFVSHEDQDFDHNMNAAGSRFIAACHNLAHIHAALRYKRPGFVEYVNSKPGLSNGTAYRMIDVARMFPNLGNIDAGPSALYLLAAPSTPETARQEALERAEAGESVTYTAAREIVDFHRQDVPAPSWEPAPRIETLTITPEGEIIGPSIPDFAGEPDTRSRIAEIPSPANHQLINASTNNEWYTPAPFITVVQRLMGGIDLDPASNALANQTVQATRYYTIADDGLAQPWYGRVFLNPPYGVEDGESNQARWSRRLIQEYQAGAVTEAVLLVNAVPGNAWFAPLWDYPICFVGRRIRFYNADTEAGQPTHSNVFVYLGLNVPRFVALFSEFGTVAARLVEDNGYVAIGL